MTFPLISLAFAHVQDFTLASAPRTTRKRSRRSLKRDCKAVMCIKSVVSFPEFDIRDAMSTVKSKKGRRKLKETALSRVRNSLHSGQSVGHPAFWLNIPLPEAHTTHELVPPPSLGAGSPALLTHQHSFTPPLTTDARLLMNATTTTDRRQTSGVGVCVDNNTDTVVDDDGLDAITHIINVAAQYGGKVQILQKSNGDLLQFQLSEEDGSGIGGESCHNITDESHRTTVTTVENLPEDTREEKSRTEEGNTQKEEENNQKEEENKMDTSVLTSGKDLSFNENPS